MQDGFLPSLKDFKKNHKLGKTQLVWHWIAADLETPVSAYIKLCVGKPYTFLLESVEGGEKLGRYSIIGFAPDTLWRCNDGIVESWNDYGSWNLYNIEPQDSLRQLLSDSHIDAVDPNLPPMAVPGLFGYLGYDMVRLQESIPDKNPDELHLPDCMLMRPTVIAVFDNIKNTICLVTPVYQHAENSNQKSEDVYEAAIGRLKVALHDMQTSKPPVRHTSDLKTPLPVTSNMTEEAFKGIVAKAMEYIRAGEIFQVVPSQRFSVPFDLPPFELYRSLRRLNPSPFMFHLNFDDFAVVGASPEILVRVRGGNVTIRPIAGTRKRGKDAAEDKALADDLLSDPKERAEHLMLLDLGRNDVGRVAETGSVKVTDQFIVENYSHVMHIVSNVEGKLQPGLDIIDALFAGFPAGTVSGAPKVRAMEIIDELEPVRRGIYGGGIGYLSSNNEMDTCIALRTAIVKKGKVYIQAGAGIVADSDPVAEYNETRNKAQAVIKAAEMAVDQTRPVPPRQA
jgi:anthranilate synthase component 1